jgi:hypothetical protein
MDAKSHVKLEMAGDDTPGKGVINYLEMTA